MTEDLSGFISLLVKMAALEKSKDHLEESPRDQSDSGVFIRLSILVALGSLWLQLYLTLLKIWAGESYYAYAWFVPPLLVFLFIQRWQENANWVSTTRVHRLYFPAALLIFPTLIFIRSVEGVDPTWRPPMILHAGIVTLVTLGLLKLVGGKDLVLGMLPVVIFGLSAIPYPFQVESDVIGTLTGWVVEAAGVALHLLGRPVLVVGSMIEYHGTKVEVTEGCSGIQSFHSLIMVSLYFGEFFRLAVLRRIFLTASACLVAIVINIGRAISLAEIRFRQGEEKFDSLHDPVGHIAFAVGGVLLLILARLLISTKKGRKAVFRVSKSNSKPTRSR